MLHLIEQHKLAETFHHVEHHALSLLRNFAMREDVLAQAQGNADEKQFAHACCPRLIGFETLDEQAGSIGSDVYCGDVHRA